MSQNNSSDLFHVQKQLSKLNWQLSQMPPGKLIYSRTDKYVKYFHSHNGVKKYLPKSKLNFIRSLAEKRYIQSQITDLSLEEQALIAYHKVLDSVPSSTQEFLSNPALSNLLNPHQLSLTANIEKWESAEYEKNPYYPEGLTHPGLNGHLFRSKSEAAIDAELFRAGIPHHYEEAIHFGEKTYFPDFTILSPKSNRLVYWEHFGIMDDPDYIEKCIQKIHVYTKNGIFPGRNLILTYEDLSNPLGLDVIQQQISMFFKV